MQPRRAAAKEVLHPLIARDIVSHLTAAGITAQLVVPEDTDVPLPERSRMELLHYPRGYPGRCAGYCAL